MEKGALFITGDFRNVEECMPSIVKDLIAFNNLDVYMYMKKDTSRRSRWGKTEYIHDEKGYCEKLIGDHLKDFQFMTEHPSYTFMHDWVVSSSRRRYVEKLKVQWPDNEYHVKWEPNPHNIDQYFRVGFGAYMMKQCMEKSGVKYDYIMRWRTDIMVTEPIPLYTYPKLKQNSLYMSENRDCIYMADHDTFLKFCMDFGLDYGSSLSPIDIPFDTSIAEIQLESFCMSRGYKILNTPIKINQPSENTVKASIHYMHENFAPVKTLYEKDIEKYRPKIIENVSTDIKYIPMELFYIGLSMIVCSVVILIHFSYPIFSICLGITGMISCVLPHIKIII